MEIQNSKFKVQGSRLNIRLHVLSPIHIGCDDIYEPTSFVIDEKRKKLIEFDPIDFIKSLKPQEAAEFTKIASGDNLLAIFKAIKRFYKPEIKGREIEITDFLVDHYKKILSMGTFDKKAVINQFTISKTAYNQHNNMPYIPGSSLKGSLRTAYLTALAVNNNIKEYWKNELDKKELKDSEMVYKLIGKRKIADKLETKLLNLKEGKDKMSSDPFRMVKVSDFLPVGDISTKIVYAVNKKKEKSDKTTLADRGGVYQIFEVIQPGTILEGTLNVNKPEKASGIILQITVDNLKSSLNKFYIPMLEAEIKTLEALGISVPLINSVNSKFKGQINRTAFIVRLGRHSGAEAVTIEGNRNIKIMQGKDKPPKYLDNATTLWLASDEPRPKNNSNLIPFGWAVLEVGDAC